MHLLCATHTLAPLGALSTQIPTGTLFTSVLPAACTAPHPHIKLAVLVDMKLAVLVVLSLSELGAGRLLVVDGPLLEPVPRALPNRCTRYEPPKPLHTL